MSIPRIARIHFVYQFIILTLIIFGISYIEILPDKRFLFLALIPVFSYQLIIIFCCTELLPLPYWLAWTQCEDLNIENQPSNDTESLNTSSQGSNSPKENCAISPIIPRARLYAKNKKSPDSVTSSDANTQTVYQNVSDIFKKAPTSTTGKSSICRANSMKVYDFKRGETNENVQTCEAQNLKSPHDQKNAKSRSNMKSPSRKGEYVKYATSPYDTPDESVESDSTVSDSTSSAITDSTGDVKTHAVYRNVSHMCKKGPVSTKATARRSESTKSYTLKRSESVFDKVSETEDNFQRYSPRNWRSLKDQKVSKSQSNLNISNQSVDETTEVTSPSKLETLDETVLSDSSDLTRSFSFPFRQRNPGRRIEVAEDLKSELNIPIMPAWNAIDYFNPSDKRRKSISTEALDRELRKINSVFEQNEKNDFTKSMEVPKESIALSTVSKRGLKPSASFNKWKQGVANYFNKTKHESVKTDDDRQEDGNKTPFYKELFLSKDVFCQDSGKKTISKTKSSPKYPNRVKFQPHSPSYISYDDYI